MARLHDETDRHSRRVASLAGQVAERIGVAPAVCTALHRSALDHQKLRAPVLRRQGVSEATVGAILRIFAGADQRNEAASVKAAAAILALCDAFDESMEFAVYECRPFEEAIGEFFRDAEGWRPCALSALRDMIAPDRSFDTPDAVPVLPQAASALLRISPESVSPAELASITERDPALTARLLGLANSAAFGSRTEIFRVCDAVLRVGVPFAHKALLAAAAGPLFVSARLRNLWRHSQEVAAIAHELAPDCGCDPNQAWLGGLLHDVGRLAFETRAASLCAREQALVQSGFPLSYAEFMVWGTDHASAGADLIASWGVPASVVDAVRHHAAPEIAEGPLSGLLYIADTLSRANDPSEAPDLAAEFRIATALATAGLSRRALESVHREAAVFALAA